MRLQLPHLGISPGLRQPAGILQYFHCLYDHRHSILRSSIVLRTKEACTSPQSSCKLAKDSRKLNIASSLSKLCTDTGSPAHVGPPRACCGTIYSASQRMTSWSWGAAGGLQGATARKRQNEAPSALPSGCRLTSYLHSEYEL